MAISVLELYWASGFLEGDGSFVFLKRGHTLRVMASQVQQEPVNRLQALFGGYLYLVPTKRPKSQPCYHWIAEASQSAGLMLTLYPLLSEQRRRQIRNALQQWVSRPPANKYKSVCPQGHPLTPENTLYDPHRRCRTCRRGQQRQAKSRYRLKAALNHQAIARQGGAHVL